MFHECFDCYYTYRLDRVVLQGLMWWKLILDGVKDLLLQYKITIDMIDSTIPNINAWFGAIIPAGIARSIVLVISLSVSLSYHIFNAPEAPDPIEIAKIIKALEVNDTSPGAITIATKLVNIESDITLGLRREK